MCNVGLMRLCAFLLGAWASQSFGNTSFSSWDECIAHRLTFYSPIRNPDQAIQQSEAYCRNLGLRPESYQSSGPTVGNKDYVCESHIMFRCRIEGCSQSRPALTINIDETSRRYARCKGNNCQSHPLSTSISGVFKIFEIPGSPGFLKVSTLDGSFVEVTSSLMTTTQNFGTCIRTR